MGSFCPRSSFGEDDDELRATGRILAPIIHESSAARRDAQHLTALSRLARSTYGVVAGRHELPDDPADHRGILSWHAQLEDRRLREAGSYGYLVEVPIPHAAVEKAASDGAIEIRLEVGEPLPGGLALYGARFGRYPIDPTVIFVRNGSPER